MKKIYFLIFACQFLVDAQASTSSTLTASPEYFLFEGSESQTGEIAISSDINWEIISDADWITLDKTHGSGFDTVTITIPKNAANQRRVDSIRIVGADVDTITLRIINGDIVNCTAGGLEDILLDEEIEYRTSLFVSGEINILDLGYFYEFSSLTTLNLRNSDIVEYTYPSTGVTYGADTLPTYIFSGTNIKYIELPGSLKAIEQFAFKDAVILNTVTLPEGLGLIGTAAFKNCSKLKTINIPSTVTKIGSSAFYGCAVLTQVILPDGIENIGSYSFKNCYQLTSANIPSSVTSIASNAFCNCRSMVAMYAFPATPINVSSVANVFDNVYDGCTLYVPTGSKILYDAASKWKAFDEIVEFDPATSIDDTAYNYSASSALDTLIINSSTVGSISNNTSWIHFNKYSYSDTTRVAFTVDENMDVAERSVVITITVQGSTEKKITITQEGKAAAPVITSTASTTAIIGLEYTYTVVASDSNGDALTYTLINAPSGMTISDNVITWTPTSGITTSGEVTLTVSDGELSATETFTITVSENGGTGITDKTSKGIAIFPNPVSSVLTIESDATIESVQIISITGAVIRSEMVCNSEINLDMQNLQNGIYLLQINTSEGSIIKRIVKQ